MTQPTDTPALRNRRNSRRQQARGSTRVRAFRNSLGLGPNIARAALDLSETGAGLLLTEELPVGRELELVLESTAHATHKALARVIWCVPTADGLFCVGTRFEKALPFFVLSALARP